MNQVIVFFVDFQVLTSIVKWLLLVFEAWGWIGIKIKYVIRALSNVVKRTFTEVGLTRNFDVTSNDKTRRMI